ncbi:MAG: UDP-N-acetylenolpyruvoylglucosamine reductase [Candidatus Amoebophilus sp. 36-38]|nr:MAG: UDP-N-acetylenolpyruvoylglucosamine reductase [Candidatus Amoebophilus sp. 36-38]
MNLQENISLELLNTFHIAAKARYYSLIKDAHMLQLLLKHPFIQNLPKLILGGGSNILFVKDFEGWVIQMALEGIQQVEEDSNHILLRVGAGVSWHQLVVYCVNKEYAGIENLSLIPGTVGAAPIQNIGAYGVEFSEVFESLEALEISTGIIKKFKKDDCAFGYRDSIFKSSLQGQYIILYVTLRLSRQLTFHTSYGVIQEVLAAMQVKELSIQAISDAVIHIRQQKLPDPTLIGNAGSFFKNPVIEQHLANRLKNEYPNLPSYPQADGQIKLPAAWLIEQCGWKGYRHGAVGVHPHQALILVNYGGASGQAIYQLAQEIQQSVAKKFGINLVPEVNIIN